MNTMKLTPLGKLVALILVLTLGAIAGAAGASATRPHAREWRCASVRPGETLWQLAKASSDDDPREVVDRIVGHNGLEGVLQPGRTLWVPGDGGNGDLRIVGRELCAAPA